MIGRVRAYIRKLNIRSQIFYSMIIVSIVIILLLSVVIFGYARNVIETNYQSVHVNDLQIASNIIELQLNNEVEQARSMLNNSAFKSLFNEKKYDTKTFGDNKVSMERVLLNYSSSNNDIRDILVVNNNGNLAFTSKIDMNRQKISEYYGSENILKEQWVQEAIEAKGKEVFFGENVLFEEDDDKTFSMVKEMINPDTQKSMGFLVFNIRKDSLSDTVGTHDEGYSTGRYMILDTKHISQNGDPKVVYFTDSDESLQNVVSAYVNGNPGNKYLFTEYHNKVSGWDMVNVINKKELSGTTKYIGIITLVAGALLIILSALLSSMISGTITYPLNLLERTIQHVGTGDYKVEEVFDDSEVGKIGNQFKNMVNNNLELNDRLLNTQLRERESELLLLQSQINPHFLYNTLDALYFMAIIRKEDEIAEMVQALSDTFKLSLNGGDEFITVSDEIDRMKAYMKVQNFRYNDRFSLIVDIDKNIFNRKVMTFMIQPLVENAFYHGLEPKIGKGWIKVSGRIEGKVLVFTVSDNGVGMEDISDVSKGYGIRNIQERIKLYYGDKFGLTFDSTLNQGTTVTVTIPETEYDA